MGWHKNGRKSIQGQQNIAKCNMCYHSRVIPAIQIKWEFDSSAYKKIVHTKHNVRHKYQSMANVLKINIKN